MITSLLYLVIAAIILGLIWWVSTQLPFMAPFAHIIQVLCVVVFVIYVIYVLIGFIGAGGHAAVPR
jgi:hypothetical protein